METLFLAVVSILTLVAFGALVMAVLVAGSDDDNMHGRG